MLHILGLTGKGIGIALLCILILVLLLLLAMLFVPIRYRIAGSKDAERGPVGEVKIHWLFHIISGMGAWDGRLHYRVRVLGIPIYDSLRKKQKEKQKKNKKERVKKEKKRKEDKAKLKKEKSEKGNFESEKFTIDDIEKEKSETEIAKTDNKEENILSGTVTEYIDREDRLQADREELGERRSFWKRLIDKIKTLWQKIINFIRMIRGLLQKIGELPGKIRDKVAHFQETIEDWKAFLSREDLKRAFVLCKKQLFRVWKNIRPRKVKADVRFGFADPSSTGQVLAMAGMLYPILGKTIVLRPDFEEQVLAGHILIKGRVTIFILLKAVWILYFNKDIKWLIRVWKKEETLHGRS